jgi:hypothetical protein
MRHTRRTKYVHSWLDFWTFTILLPKIFSNILHHFQVLGPRLMENRKPFQLRNILIVYNFMHVLISIYIFFEGGMAGWFGDYNWRCQPYDPSRNNKTMRVSSSFAEIWRLFLFDMKTEKISERFLTK